MKHRRREPTDWASQQLQGTASRPALYVGERRDRVERRVRVLWAICYGSFNPRRRRPSRRLGDSRFHFIDWYSAHLLAVSVGILLLSAADAFFTGVLLLHGADEVNPVMGALLYRGVAMFAGLKMAMTGVGIVLMVFLARYRFMRVIRVSYVLYGILIVYAWLIGYEIWMLNSAIE
jgi:hypothetical protein